MRMKMSKLNPYYQDDFITIYHADCRDIIPFLAPVDMVFTDPPYGINYRSNHNSSRKGKWAKWVRNENLPGIIGDDKPLEPEHVMIADKVVIFGGNYCADKLPPSPCWIVWDKRVDISPNNQADCELVWTNLKKPSRIYRHLWSGMLRAGEENISKSEKHHPHQKPLGLCRFVLSYSEVPKGACLLDPYCGSGSILRAAKDLGIRAIGIDIEEKYCEISAERAAQEVLQL
jgi:site-specific DNA-methyltransferase (adenine-specific)